MAGNRKKKPNSPRGPRTSLREPLWLRSPKSINVTRTVPSAAARWPRHWGCRPTVEPFLGKAATLKEYGLITEGGGSAEVSDLFKAMYHAYEPARLERASRTPCRRFGRPRPFSRDCSSSSAAGCRMKRRWPCALRRRSGSTVTVRWPLRGAFRTSLIEYGLIDSNGNVLPVRDQRRRPTSAVPTTKPPMVRGRS